MKIVIVGGWKKVDFLAKSLLSKGHEVTMIHDDEGYCKVLSRNHNAAVISGDGSMPHILEDANIEQADIVIALTPVDADNLVICQLAKKVYGVKKAFATVGNPKNVEVFKKLGINSVISSTHIVSGIIEQMSSFNEILSAIPIEEGKIVILELEVKENYDVCGKTIAKLGISENAIIGCILRKTGTIIPNGKTKIQQDDKLIILSPPHIQNDLIQLLIGRGEHV